MPIRRRRNRYQQVTEFEGGHIIRLRKDGFSFYNIAENLIKNVFVVHECWLQGTKEKNASRTLGSRKPRGTIETKDSYV
ncbi:uncharacterized protein TNCV_2278531 [Trichonephila clavipes]|uniref:Uncharacterized protein n=1 Tax=Trichonephila clavipes TaxID=2585209 RepID=A0A8X6R947_TRICX|nr:uncharacterized protein TNCV_2278531 [Trichonephila clavipes]